MEKRLYPLSAFRFTSLLLGIILFSLFTACESRDSKVEQTIMDYLKTRGAADVKEVELVLFHTDSNAPERAYASARLVYASGDVSAREGQKNMHEGSGYILKRDGSNWAIEASAKYTDKPEDAAKLLAGEKIRR
jgi:hypothetical protein